MFYTKIILWTLSIAALYLIISTYAMNFGLVMDTIFGNYPISYKWNLLIALLGGLWTAMGKFNLIVLVVTAFFTGINIVLLTQRFSALRSSGKLHLVVGGGSILGIASGGCAACGLSILSLIGVTSSLAFLPLGGMEISLLVVILLSFSLYSLIRSYQKELACNINT